MTPKFFVFLFIMSILKFENIIQKKNLFDNSNNNISNNISENKPFLIIQINYTTDNLFTYYNHYLGCILNAITMNYIPIFDLRSYPSIFNNFSKVKLKKNPYEDYFDQPFNLTLKEILKSKNYRKFNCHKHENFFLGDKIINNKESLDFWRVLAKKYMPIKEEIIKKALSIKSKLFNSSNNILGILPRGVDYLDNITRNYIQPDIDLIFKDIKKFDIQNNYDYFFLVTDDNTIRLKFKNEFGRKLKYFFNYNLDDNNHHFNENLNRRMKTYLVNIIILTKCLDVIMSMSNGAIGSFILSKGFRNKIVYNFGFYKNL